MIMAKKSNDDQDKSRAAQVARDEERINRLNAAKDADKKTAEEKLLRILEEGKKDKDE
jgi:hypothetical protein